MSEPASLTRILAGGAGMSPTLAGLSDWLEAITADAVARNRTNIIIFPLKRRAINDDDAATAPAA